MQRILFFLYGVLCHVLFLGVFAYLAGFLANAVVPKSIDSGAESPVGVALAINVGLLLLFGLQHSVMARPGFKRWWTKIVPTPIERSTYVLASNLVVVLLLWAWQPMGGTLWNVESEIVRTILWCLFAGGLLLIVASSFLINHFDLFGTRQVWMHLRGQEYTQPEFKSPMLYRMVRHPLYVGWILAIWCTPTLSAGHVVFAVGMTGYILIAVLFEERDLVDAHAEYAEYRERVPMLVPFAK